MTEVMILSRAGAFRRARRTPEQLEADAKAAYAFWRDYIRPFQADDQAEGQIGKFEWLLHAPQPTSPDQAER